MLALDEALGEPGEVIHQGNVLQDLSGCVPHGFRGPNVLAIQPS